MNKKNFARFAPSVAGLLIALAPAFAYAERPEIDCNALDEPTYNHFAEDLSMQLSEALENGDNDEALKVANEAMDICTTDVYTEYTLGSLYLLKNDVPNVCYHFERLLGRPDNVRKENSDIFKSIDKKYKKIKDECAKFIEIEVNCELKGTSLSITGDGVSLHHLSCPHYGYVRPGTYTVKASKQGYTSQSFTFAASEENTSLSVPELEDPNARGHIEVKCPRGSTGFTLTDSKGKTSEYTCPWIGDIAADTYKVKLNDSELEPTTLVVEKQGTVIHEISNGVSTGCSANPLTTNNSAPLFAGAFALLAALGFAVRRRRDAE